MSVSGASMHVFTLYSYVMWDSCVFGFEESDELMGKANLWWWDYGFRLPIGSYIITIVLMT